MWNLKKLRNLLWKSSEIPNHVDLVQKKNHHAMVILTVSLVRVKLAEINYYYIIKY